MEILNHGRKLSVHVPVYEYESDDVISTNLNNLLSNYTGTNPNAVRTDLWDNVLPSIRPIGRPVENTPGDYVDDGVSAASIFVSDIFVFNDDPSTVVFFDNHEQKVVKTVKLDGHILGVFIPSSFNKAPQVLVSCFNEVDAFHFYVIKLSLSAKGEIIVRKYKQPAFKFNKPLLGCDGFYIASCLSYSFDFWLERFAYDNVLTDTGFGVASWVLFKNQDQGSVIMRAKSSADFRNHKAYPPPGVLENYSNQTVEVASWTVFANKNSVVLKKPNNMFMCAIIGSTTFCVFNHTLSKPAVFNMSGIVDVSYNASKLFVAVNDNQIYAYEQFQSLISASLASNSDLIRNPGAEVEPVGYNGCIDDIKGIDLPRPNYVINVGAMFDHAERLYGCDVFFANEKEILTFCTYNSSARLAQHSLYVMSAGKLVFKKSFRHSIKSVKGITSGMDMTVTQNTSTRRLEPKIENSLMLTVRLANDSIVRFEVDENAKAGSNIRAISGSGPGRFLDF
jgi:hypothetical protein